MMRVMRVLFVAIFALILPVASVNAQVSISIGVNVPVYPDLVPVPGYPVYYDPALDSNYFFYDGQYWVYDNDNWYTSDWYNGPWELVDPEYVPVFILRVPVRYYRRPPEYFREWHPDGPPRWEQHWGHDWEARHRDWDRWDQRSAPPPAPLPTYQRQYSGDRYPRRDEQRRSIRDQNYRYRPRDPATERVIEHAPEHSAPNHSDRSSMPSRSPAPSSIQRQSTSQRSPAPREIERPQPKAPSDVPSKPSPSESRPNPPEELHQSPIRRPPPRPMPPPRVEPHPTPEPAPVPPQHQPPPPPASPVHPPEQHAPPHQPPSHREEKRPPHKPDDRE